MTDIIKAERATIKFFDGVEVDGYQMPDGEFRVGIASASQVAGYQPNWLGRTLSRGGTSNKALQSLGFSQQIQEVVSQSIRGDREAQTISLDDFACLLLYASEQKKSQARALLKALLKMSVNDYFRDGFGEKPLTIEEKRKTFYQSYAASLNWSESDKDDIKDLALGFADWG